MVRSALKSVGGWFALAVLLLSPASPVRAQRGPAPRAPAQRGPVKPVRSGAQVYVATCITCHQANGQGLRGAFPPLAKADWVTGRAEVPIAIVLHGMTGEIAVGGIKYNVPMARLDTLSDQEIANVVTYVRSQWGNKAAAVTAADVAGVRTATKSRKTPWTPGELRKAFP